MQQPSSDASPAIGVVIPWLGSPEHLQIFEGARAVAQAAGLTIFAVQAGNLAPGAANGDLVLTEQFSVGTGTAAGWIMLNLDEAAGWARGQVAAGRPVVLVSPPNALAGVIAVVPDNLGGARDAVTHLLDHGRSRIAFVGNLANQDIAERYEGYRQAHSVRGLAPTPALTLSVDWQRDYWSAAAGAEAARRLLAVGEPFDAIFAATDELALGALEELRRAGVRVPRDCALVGFDDTSAARTSAPTLTTVRQPFASLGAQAATLLIEVIRGATPAERHVVPSPLIQRVSCGCPPAFARALPLPEAGVGTPVDVLTATLVGTRPATLSGALDVRAEVQHLADAFAAAVEAENDSVWVEALDSSLARLAEEISDQTRFLAALAILRTSVEGLHPNQRKRADYLSGIAERAVADTFMRMAMVEQSRWMEIAQLSSDVAMQMAGAKLPELLSLGWLGTTPVAHAYLLRFREVGGKQHLEVVGAHHNDSTPGLAIGETMPVAQFPPPALLAISDTMTSSLFPISTTQHLYGVLYVAVPNTEMLCNSSTAGTWATHIAAQIEVEELVASLRASRDALETAYQLERTLAETVRELACPVIPVAKGVIVLPLIGVIDSRRAERILDELLNGITRHSASAAVIDITGVPLVDTAVAGHLLRAFQAARLLGAETVLTGIRPELAQTMVHIGITTGTMATCADLASGLRYALARQGLQIGPTYRAG